MSITSLLSTRVIRICNKIQNKYHSSQWNLELEKKVAETRRIASWHRPLSCPLLNGASCSCRVLYVRKMMQKFDTEVGVSFSSRKRTSRSCICLVILSVAVVLLVTTSAIFVTLYVTEKRTTVAKTSSEDASLSTVSAAPSTAASTEPNTMTPSSTAKPSAMTYFPTTQTIGEQKYCGSKTCLLTSLGKVIFPKGLIRVYAVTCLISLGNIYYNLRVPCERRVSFNLPTKIGFFYEDRHDQRCSGSARRVTSKESEKNCRRSVQFMLKQERMETLLPYYVQIRSPFDLQKSVCAHKFLTPF